MSNIIDKEMEAFLAIGIIVFGILLYIATKSDKPKEIESKKEEEVFAKEVISEIPPQVKRKYVRKKKVEINDGEEQSRSSGGGNSTDTLG